MKLNFLLIAVFLLAGSVPTTAQHKSPEKVEAGHLLEIGSAPRLQHAPTNSHEFKVLSYNIRWRGGDTLHKLIELFKADPEIGGAAILGLQEVDRNKKRTLNVNTVRLLADELGMHYAWTAPPVSGKNQEEETGVAILSIFPLHDIRRLVLPHPGPGKRRRVALGATIKIGGTPIRFYSVHAETRIATDRKLAQFKAALEDLETVRPAMPAIVLGDFNTWELNADDKTTRLFEGAKFHTPFNGDATFCRRILLVDLKLKLDWVWLRDLEVKSFGIDRDVDYSDHWPLWVILKSPVKAEPARSDASNQSRSPDR